MMRSANRTMARRAVAVASRGASRALSVAPGRPCGGTLGGVDSGPAHCNRRGTRHFNFASSQYASCFDDIPTPDVPKLRKDAVDYLDSFDTQSWYEDPVSSLLSILRSHMM